MARRYNWAHGWVPLTRKAALQKAHYNRKAAAKIKLGTPRRKSR